VRSLKEYLSNKELNESVLDPVKKDLNPVLWDKNDKLKKSVKVHILKKFEIWLKAYTDKSSKNAFLLGSNASYQYNETVDIDVNMVVDVTDEKLKEMTKMLPNGQLLPGTKHPINYFISNQIRKEWKQSSIYDLIADKWIIKPKKVDKTHIVANYRMIIEIARFFIAGVTSAISEYESDVSTYETYTAYLEDAAKNEKDEIQELLNFKLHEIIADIEGIRIAHRMLRSFRKKAFEGEAFEASLQIKIKDGSANISINNILYKYIEKLGLINKMIGIEKELEKWEKLLN